LACKKFGIRARIQKYNSEYLINLDQFEIPIKTFEAAKFIVNALVIEKRNRVNVIKEMQAEHKVEKDTKKSYWQSRKERQDKVTRDWGESRRKGG
jgi:hypothetical protein